MSLALAGGFWLVLGGYLLLGLLFALVFVRFAAPRLDPAAIGMPLGARLLIVPGATVLWPLLLWKWLHRQPPPLA